MNRMTSQFSRGGQAVCFVHEPLYAALADSVASVDNCASDNWPAADGAATVGTPSVLVAVGAAVGGAVGILVLCAVLRHLLRRQSVSPLGAEAKSLPKAEA